MIVKFKKLSNEAITPTYAHEEDAGVDLYSLWFENKGEVDIHHTGIAVEIPSGYVGLIYPRSSIYKKMLILANSVGVIDSNFRGELVLMFRKTGDDQYRYETYGNRDRIGQLIVIPIPKLQLVQVENLSSSDRGENGLGSTGD